MVGNTAAGRRRQGVSTGPLRRHRLDRRAGYAAEATSMTERLAKADLHVHSWHSTVNGDLPFLKSRDCYSDPVDVYKTAKARGMDIVTITDHDSINGCLELLSHMPD